MKNLILIFMLILLFNGCSQKETVFKKELVCYEQLLIPQPIVKVRIHPEDVEKAKAFKDANDMGYKFYEEQVKRNNEFCISKSREDDNNNFKEVEKR